MNKTNFLVTSGIQNLEVANHSEATAGHKDS